LREVINTMYWRIISISELIQPIDIWHSSFVEGLISLIHTYRVDGRVHRTQRKETFQFLVREKKCMTGHGKCAKDPTFSVLRLNLIR
jgi:hypothetical protein